jgi:hypothetical protein
MKVELFNQVMNAVSIIIIDSPLDVLCWLAITIYKVEFTKSFLCAIIPIARRGVEALISRSVF